METWKRIKQIFMKNRQTRIFSNRQRRPDAAGITGDRLPAERGAQLGQVLHAGGAARDVADHEPDERDDLKVGKRLMTWSSIC